MFFSNAVINTENKKLQRHEKLKKRRNSWLYLGYNFRVAYLYSLVPLQNILGSVRMLSELHFVQENDPPDASHTVPVVYLENKEGKAKGQGSQLPVITLNFQKQRKCIMSVRKSTRLKCYVCHSLPLVRDKYPRSGVE